MCPRATRTWAWCLAVARCLAVGAVPEPGVWVRIDPVYTSDSGTDVVLLKDAPHIITGTAYGPADAVDVWLDGKFIARVQVTGAKGNMSKWPVWQATLPPMPPGFGHTVNITNSNATTRSSYNASTGINFGTVLLCSGQSNMALHVGPGHFTADNGTAESLASSAFTGKISILLPYIQRFQPWQAVSNATLPTFSAVCWYTGKNYWQKYMAHGAEPLGLMSGPVSGTPIEYWVRNKLDVAGCGNITGKCWNSTEAPNPVGRSKTGMSHLYNELIRPLTTAGLGVSAIIWDQAEADVGCHVEQFPTPFLGGDPAYTCLQKALIEGWRSDFAAVSGHSTHLAGIPWVGVQLPGYGAPNSTGIQTNSVFEMRLGQAAGVAGTQAAEIVPTYDLSCPECPWGSIHPTDKQDVGARIANRLGVLMLGAAADVGPTATAALVTARSSSAVITVTVVFEAQGPLQLLPTRNCTLCCTTGSDFDVSINGSKWVAGKAPPVVLEAYHDRVQFEVNVSQAEPLLDGPVVVRYTATQTYPQCAISDSTRLPAYPFQLLAQALAKRT